MRIKYTKRLAFAGVIVLSTLMVAPSNASDPVVPAAAASPATGTIRVVSLVVNDNLGSKSASDFQFSVAHWGTPVVGSPFAGVGSTGFALNLAPGTYVVSTPVIDGYNGLWSGVGIENGFIDLQAGQDITIIRTSNDVGPSDAVVVAPETPATEDGGTLPATSSPWFNALAAALLVSAAGTIGLRKSLKAK